MRVRTMRISGVITTALAIVVASVGVASAITVNPGFESGDTTGWTPVGGVSVVDSSFGVTPTEGSFQIFLTTGSGAVPPGAAQDAMGLPANTIRDILSTIPTSSTRVRHGSAFQQTFDAEAGDQIMFDWNFLTNEIQPDAATYTDFLWSHLTGVGQGALQHVNQPTGFFNSSSSSFTYETGWNTFALTLITAGTYTLTLGVNDVEDRLIDTGAVVDNFQLIKQTPEPKTVLLLSSGLVGLAWIGRRP